ncbi:uncharacterized protein LOC113279978 [Papaver somniferum]|uniref:uncharacterized protein LOC113279978 n=1 Tax=Papaver somniferum TaxID=3469 RepID=UPI000E700BA5|nr:uncharacterized protein LOC113279978 [Papaver somniferum]
MAPSLPPNPPALWKPHESPYFTISCDASFDINNGLTGVGLILRDFAGNWKRCFAKSYAGVADSERAECLSMYDAVVWCREMRISHDMFETDLQTIDGFINNSSSAIVWENEDILHDVIHIMKGFPDWKCRFIPRKCNKPADELAKFGKKFNVTHVWHDKPPSVIENLLLLDSIYSRY